MTQILALVGALIALAMLRPVLRSVIALLAGKQIGAGAVAKQPESIHLARATPQAWKNPATAGATASALRSCSFDDAGSYTIPELPGVVVRLMANSAESFYAAIYEHPKAGNWCEVFTHYADGTSATFTTRPPTGLDPRPGHPVVNIPGTTVPKLLERARNERAPGVFASHSVDRAVQAFETAYAESIAWRKGHGISTREVVAVSRRAA